MIHEDFYYGNNCIEYYYRCNDFKIIGIKYSETDYEFYINDYNGSTIELDINTFIDIDEAMYFQQMTVHPHIDHIIYAANKIYNAKEPPNDYNGLPWRNDSSDQCKGYEVTID